MSFITCSTACASEIPALAPTCSIRKRDGGIQYFIFLTCDATLPADPSVLANWQPLIDACQIRISPRVRGQKPKGTATNTRLDSCTPETKTGATKTFSFASYDTKQNLSDYDFWKYIDQNSTGLNVAAVGCDGRIYPFTSFALDLDEVVEETKEQASFMDGVITITETYIMKPFVIPGLVDLLIQEQASLCPTGTAVDSAPTPPTTTAEIIL